MKRNVFAFLGAALALTAGLMFTGCPGTGTASTMTVNFKFADFTVDSFTVTAYNGKTVDDGCETVNATVAEDGASATCTVTDSYTNDDGWLTLKVVAKKGAEELAISFKESSNSEKGAWFEFAEDSTLTITYALTQSETATSIYSDSSFTPSSSFTQVVEASKFADLTITTLKIKCANVSDTDDNGWWLNVNTEDSWNTDIELKNSWSDDVSGYYYTTTDSDFISAVKTNGLYFAGSTTLTCELSVLYE